MRADRAKRYRESAPVAGVLIPGPAPVTDGAEANLAIHVGVAP